MVLNKYLYYTQTNANLKTEAKGMGVRNEVLHLLGKHWKLKSIGGEGCFMTAAISPE